MITLQELHERDKRPPSVTVYMICYNHEKYLDEAMYGVLMQKTNFPVNIVIHDDASPDRSGEIIRKYAAENPNITAILEETNFYQNGKSFLPIVIPHFTGKYIACCECDDFWIDENKLQIQVDYLENNPDCIAVYSNSLPVNKYSQYDEAARVPAYAKTSEGDYPSDDLFAFHNQLATCVIRNFWQFMSPEDVNFYASLRGPGDRKIMALCLRLGRVHYFSQEFAAYRHVIDEGTSFSATIRRLSKWERLKHDVRYNTDIRLMLNHFFGIKFYRIYIQVLYDEIRFRLKYHKSIIKEADLSSRYHLRNIPLHAYAAFPFYCVYRAARKLARILFRHK